MTHRIIKPKWILYRHTSDFNLIRIVAKYLKEYSAASISKREKTRLYLS